MVSKKNAVKTFAEKYKKQDDDYQTFANRMKEELKEKYAVKIDFGTVYKGKSLAQILKTDKGESYLQWIASQPILDIDKDDTVMPWGKYKDKTIAEVKREDEEYMTFLTNNNKEKIKLKKNIETLLPYSFLF